MATTSPAFEAIRKAIEHATAVQNKQYDIIDGYSFYFEADDTDAAKDVESFANLCNNELGVRYFKRLCIKKDSVTPVWDVLGFCDHIAKSRSTSRNLVLLHYAGHGGTVNRTDSGLDCYASRCSKQSFPWKIVMERVALPLLSYDKALLARTDVLVVLNCCYAGASTRGNLASSRTVELIAASDAYTTAECRTRKISFTQEFCSIVMQMRRENGLVQFSEVLARILARKAKSKTPIHQCLEGSIPITLRLARPAGFSKENVAPTAHSNIPHPTAANPVKNDTSLVLASPGTAPAATVKVLCSVKFGEDIGEERLEEFLSWIRHLDHNFTIKTQCAYKTSSTVMICSVPLGIWLRLKGVNGFEIISLVVGENMIRP